MRLFISYAHVDKAIVKDWVVSKLVAGGHDVWFDDRLVVGQDWKQQLSDEIERSDALVYCMTPESVASDWCQWELARAVDFGKPIIPVLMQARTQLPDQLKKLQYVDFSDGPTGDAVARLMGGLQNLSPAQIPPAPADPKGKPAQLVEQDAEVSANIVMKILRDPAIQAIIGIMSLVLAVIAIAITQNGGSDPPSTQQAEPPTPATPIVVALRDLEIRYGPSANFSRLNILPINGTLDILGISEDRLWYQVLLQDGRTGWILAASSGAGLKGDRGVVSVIVPTLTPSNTPTRTNTPLNTPTATSTPSPTDTLTETHRPTGILTDTDTPLISTHTSTVTNTPDSMNMLNPGPTRSVIPTLRPVTMQSVSGQYPCEANIVSGGSSLLRVIRANPSPSASLRNPIRYGSSILITQYFYVNRTSTWYQISDTNYNVLGWIPVEYVTPSEQCPEEE